MRIHFRMISLRAISAFVALLLAIPFTWGYTGFYTWLSPFILLNSVFTLKTFVWLNSFAFLIILFVLFRKRWFCKKLCPAGWSCDRISDLSPRKKSVYNGFPDVGKWLAVLSLSAAIVGFPLFLILDPLAIFNGFFTIISGEFNIIAILSFSGFIVLLIIHLFFPGIWCSKLCPLGGLQLVLYDLKIRLKKLFQRNNPESPDNNSGRRYFLMTGMGLLAGVAIPRLIKPSENNTIRPPASVEPVLYNSLCCRCGNCIKACPTGILKPFTGSGDILAWLTPEIVFKSGYCLENCNLCSRVCPSGAILLFSPEAKRQLFIGTAEIRLENCLLKNNSECVKCKESCKYEAIEFVAGANILNTVPVIDKTKCVGCGACEVICPTECIKIRAK
jgi:ferredoxin-type protein NapF